MGSLKIGSPVSSGCESFDLYASWQIQGIVVASAISFLYSETYNPYTTWMKCIPIESKNVIKDTFVKKHVFLAAKLKLIATDAIIWFILQILVEETRLLFK